MTDGAQIAALPRTAGATAAARRPSRTRGWSTETLLGVSGLTGLFIAWYIGTDILAPAGSLVRQFSPVAALASFPDLIRNTDLFTHIVVSLTRVLIGLGIAIAAGVPLGLAVGSWRPSIKRSPRSFSCCA
jgi:ABC-type nitrate/sulfonate/bicarbonate transport system, permease component